MQTHTLQFNLDLNVMVLLFSVKAVLNEAPLHEERARDAALVCLCVCVLFIIALTELLRQHSSHQ